MNPRGPAPTSSQAHHPAWQQGDVILAPDGLDFIHWADLAQPITDSSRESAAQDPSGIEVIVTEGLEGFAIVTQTCDLVRDQTTRPYVELAPLVHVADPGTYKHIKKLTQPRYAVIPALEDKRLVADLDRCMTIEKPVLSHLTPVRGMRTEDEGRQFARALARKRARPALPNDFVAAFAPVRDHLIKTFKKTNSEAEHLDAIHEFRVHPEPSWDAPSITLTVYLFKQEQPGVTYDWPTVVAAWQAMFKPSGRYKNLFMQVVKYEQVDSLTYLTSDEIDLDNLSPPG